MKLWPDTFNLEKELDALYREVATITALKDMTQTSGWQHLRDNRIEKIMQYDREIAELAQHPNKNDRALRWKTALRFATMGLLQAVETTLNVEREKLLKIHQLETIRKEALAQDNRVVDLREEQVNYG